MALDVAPHQDTARRDALVGRLFNSAIEAAEVLSIFLGDRLNLYAMLQGAGPVTSAELAARAGTAERYTREWLEQQATAGFLDVDDATASSSQRRYSLPAEFGEIFVDPDSPIHLAPFAELIGLLAAHVPDVVDVFRSGAGLAYDR